MALIRCRHLVVGGAYSGLNVHGHRIHPLAKRKGGRGVLKKIWLCGVEARAYSRGGLNSRRGREEPNS